VSLVLHGQWVDAEVAGVDFCKNQGDLTMNEFDDIIYKRVQGANYETIRGSLKLFSIYLAIDGRRSVRSIARDDAYELDDLMVTINRLDKLGLIAPVDGSGGDYTEAPSEANFIKLPKEFRTGITTIDKQHQQLVDMVNHLGRIREAAFENPKTRKVATGQVVAEMLSYSISHFAFEEALMQDANYKFFDSHKRAHNLFVTRANEYKQRFTSGEDIIDELFDMLNRWLFNHIRSDDMAYTPALKTRIQELDQTKSGWLGRMLKRFFK
jgi:hemerythrin